MRNRQIAKTIEAIILAFFSYIEYFCDLRPYLIRIFEIYVTGFIDGMVATATLLVGVLYLASLFEKKSSQQDLSHPLTKVLISNSNPGSSDNGDYQNLLRHCIILP